MAGIQPDTQTVTVTPALAATDIHKRFGPFEVLRGISLSAHEREVVTILGSSDSGTREIVPRLISQRPTFANMRRRSILRSRDEPSFRKGR